ncbi:co-chaperone GroES [Microvenator marinus]|jgi:chaperonin GroES|uniref:Co-chaperonin GroES n=1 Tax=Microvenator marinus TaxID=2600177 RepID=A0A5B8XJV1_9DELT|nr:co-chaperone GroES [Microvenator marinus]QED25814.1 co-chaperone GroES [Microvenator marinus]
MAVKPLYDRVLVERVESEQKTASGLYIPETAKEKPLEGFVRSVGPGKRGDDGNFIKMQVQEGDRILFGKYSGTEITIAGKEHLILGESEILAVITE